MAAWKGDTTVNKAFTPFLFVYSSSLIRFSVSPLLSFIYSFDILDRFFASLLFVLFPILLKIPHSPHFILLTHSTFPYASSSVPTFPLILQIALFPPTPTPSMFPFAYSTYLFFIKQTATLFSMGMRESERAAGPVC